MQTLARSGTKNDLVGVGATATSYNSGDVIGVPTELKGSTLDRGATGILGSLVVIDLDAQKKAIDFYFFDRQTTSQGANDAAFALNDTEAAYLLGRVSVVAADYTESSAMAEATKLGIGLGLEAKSATTSVWVVAVAREALTVTTADGIKVRPTIWQD